MKIINFIVTVFSTHVYFLVVLAAVIMLPGTVHMMGAVSGVEWIYLITIGAMTIGCFYCFCWLVDLDADVRREEEVFKLLDVNHDGFISRGEAAKYKRLIRVFDQADADHDNKLSRLEFSKALIASGHKMQMLQDISVLPA